ncbi:MAG: DNA double-strand break repair nuclease NurA [Sulfolobales archaeon]|nr:DNA double-strand break repair nuclease NurA [Sulfolobales archaeon]MCX8186156.1 DNA double-strand break repair nuclease NurA [Sulfolobales archaeon]MDW7969451.1 DNA double-strand break repair nuclease NurA [Sulfolobales archaeon]
MVVIPLHDLLINDLSGAMGDLLNKVTSVGALNRYLRDVDVYPIRSSPSSDPVVVVASDSSSVLKKLSIATIYAVQAASLRASLKSPSSSKLTIKSLAGYYMPVPDEVVPHELIDRVIQLISKSLEVRSLFDVLDEGSIALFDGSLLSFLWGYTERRMPKGFYPRSYERINDIWYEVFSGIIKTLHEAKPLFIAKTLMRNYYVDMLLSNDVPKEYKESVNDLILINALRRFGRLPKTPYVLQPIYVERKDLPRPLNDLKLDLGAITPITVTYVAFNPASQPYQLSMPGKVGIDELVELVSEVYLYSLSGYPDPLKVTHNKCKISGAEFRLMLYKLGLSSVPTGRELLGEFL